LKRILGNRFIAFLISLNACKTTDTSPDNHNDLTDTLHNSKNSLD
jgi:hypothetical protein